MNQPLLPTELVSSTRYRTRFDLSTSSQARVIVNVQSAGAATPAQLCAQYSTDETAWLYLDGISGPCASIDATGVRASAFVNLVALAKADVFLRIVGKDGTGSADPAFGQISIQIK